MSQKFVIFVHAKEDEGAKFAHALMYASELDQAGHTVKVIFDGASVKTLANIVQDTERPVHKLYSKVKEQGLLAGVCEFCSTIMGVEDVILATELTKLNSANGHPSIAEYVADGYIPLIM